MNRRQNHRRLGVNFLKQKHVVHVWKRKRATEVRPSFLAEYPSDNPLKESIVFIYSGRLNETCRFNGRSEEIVLLKNICTAQGLEKSSRQQLNKSSSDTHTEV